MDCDKFKGKENPIDYEIFLQRRNEVIDCLSNRFVKIKCISCKKESLIRWTNLIERRESIRYQALCSKCVMKKRSKQHLRGFYYNIKFESSYELGFIHHCIKNNINVKRCNFKIRYIDEKGKERTYSPDFVVNDCIVEIKGIINETVLKKKEYALIFCKEHNYDYKLLFKEDLKKLNNFIECVSYKDLLMFDQQKLVVTSYPYTFNVKETVESDYLGFVFVKTNFVTNKKICDIAYGKATKECLAMLCDNDLVHNQINVIGYGKFDYDLIHLKNLTIEKINNLPRTPSEEEKRLYKEKYHELNVGENNPNYQHYWSEEKRKNASKKLKNKNVGIKNGMYGKAGTSLKINKENDSRGNHYFIYDKDMNFIKEIKNTYLATKEFNLSKKELYEIIENHRLVSNCYIDFSDKTKILRKKRSKHTNKGQRCAIKRKVQLFSQNNQLIKEFNSLTEATNELKFNRKKLVDNKFVFKDGRYVICEPTKIEVKTLPHNAKAIDLYDENNNFIKTLISISALAKELHVGVKKIKNALDSNVLVKNFYLKTHEGKIDKRFLPKPTIFYIIKDKPDMKFNSLKEIALYLDKSLYLIKDAVKHNKSIDDIVIQKITNNNESFL